MSQFECPVVRVSIEPHPNADAIELARVGDYLSIVKKGQFKDGDLAVYIPEQSVLPQWMLEQMGFWDELNGKGKLSGAAGDRVRAMKLRGILSQGLLYPAAQIKQGPPGGADHEFTSVRVRVFGKPYTAEEAMGKLFSAHDMELTEGESADEFLGVTKYEPAVPLHMAGRVSGGDLDATFGYDFENLKKVPALFDDGMEVAITEKIHGTLLQVALIPEAIYGGKKWAEKAPRLCIKGDPEYALVVTSKGQGAKGLMLDTSDESNLYVKTAQELALDFKLLSLRMAVGAPADKPIFLFGEIFGDVQDLTYGMASGKTTFRAFDAYVGTRSEGHFVDHHTFVTECGVANIDTVPLLYVGPYSKEVVQAHTDGKSVLKGAEQQIREGVVVKATTAPRHPRYGRRIAKSVSEAYLLRKNANATEFQ